MWQACCNVVTESLVYSARHEKRKSLREVGRVHTSRSSSCESIAYKIRNQYLGHGFLRSGCFIFPLVIRHKAAKRARVGERHQPHIKAIPIPQRVFHSVLKAVLEPVFWNCWLLFQRYHCPASKADVLCAVPCTDIRSIPP